MVQYFSFQNQIEEMVSNYPSENHTAFRVNDQRRYSMYFHRCMAYKLMLRYEQENNLRFDWVVLVRLVILLIRRSHICIQTLIFFPIFKFSSLESYLLNILRVVLHFFPYFAVLGCRLAGACDAHNVVCKRSSMGDRDGICVV